MLLVKINGVLDKNLTLYLLVDQICTYREKSWRLENLPTCLDDSFVQR